VTSAPQRNVAQKILSNVQDFLPSATVNPGWQLFASLLPVLDATPAGRRLFYFDYRHTMVAAKVFVADFAPTPPNVLRRYINLFCEAGAGEDIRLELILPEGQVSGPWTSVVAVRDSGSIQTNFFSLESQATDMAPLQPYLDVPPGGHLRLSSVTPMLINNILDFGFLYEELAAPVVFEPQEIAVTIVEV